VALYGLEVVKVYKDEAISGTVPLGERPAGAELLADAADGLFDAVLLYRLDGSDARSSRRWTRTTVWSRRASP
jgi:DNA invertase Pin-like site-specific DNA recombinase